MKNLKTKQLKENQKLASKVLKKYKIYRFKITQIESNLKYADQEQKDLLTKYKSYVSMIDGILEELKPDNRRILKDTFIKYITRKESGYSKGTYYSKLRQALNDFLDFYR